MNKKLIASLIVCTATFSLLTGCFGKSEDPLASESKDNLITYIKQLEQENTDLDNKLKGVQTDDVETAAISQFSDGTGRLTLNSVDKIVTLPTPFEYPTSLQSYNASAIELTDSITIKPSSNWAISLTGTEVQLEHSNGISGVIKIGNIDTNAEIDTVVEDLQPYISGFFNTMPPETIKYTKIYVDTDWKGMDASANTFINEKDAQLRCGMIGYNELCITYMFAYIGEQDASKDELILSLLQTMKVYDKELRVE